MADYFDFRGNFKGDVVMGAGDMWKKIKDRAKGKIAVLAVIAVVVVIIVAVVLVRHSGSDKLGKDDFMTSAQLEDAINISELSTAEFVYNGIAEKYKDVSVGNVTDNGSIEGAGSAAGAGSSKKVECYIAYEASVKVGIDMEAVTFEINHEDKTITPVLPEINVSVASLNEDSISYIPQNPNVSLKDVLKACREDAESEARNSKELYQTAEENLQSVIEALLSPIVKNAGYTVKWDENYSVNNDGSADEDLTNSKISSHKQDVDSGTALTEDK